MDKCDLCNMKETLDKMLKLLSKGHGETAPLCFHCGIDYEKDLKYCGHNHNTWKPVCNCLNKPTIRIVTGNYDWEEDCDED